jgi:hypothetical protein
MYMSQSILDQGFADWIMHPISLIGYYPLGYPSGFMYLLASLSALTGIELITIIPSLKSGPFQSIGYRWK